MRCNDWRGRLGGMLMAPMGMRPRVLRAETREWMLISPSGNCDNGEGRKSMHLASEGVP